MFQVETWRSRGSIPGPVDVTCSLLEIQLKDGFIELVVSIYDLLWVSFITFFGCSFIFCYCDWKKKRREEQPADALYSEHLLQMLYTMGILRLTTSFWLV